MRENYTLITSLRDPIERFQSKWDYYNYGQTLEEKIAANNL